MRLISFCGVLAISLALAGCKGPDKYRDFSESNQRKAGGPREDDEAAKHDPGREVSREPTPVNEATPAHSKVRTLYDASEKETNRATTERVEQKARASTPTPTPTDPMHRPLDPVGRPLSEPSPGG